MVVSEQAGLKGFMRKSWWILGTIAGFSLFVNILMLTGSIYMLQVYDRVLGSGSVETLVALTVVIAFLFTMMGILDFVRGRLGARFGARLQETMDDRVFRASLVKARRTGQYQTAMTDLAAIQRFTGSPIFMALFDLPLSPLFFAALFIFHPWLGWFAIFGGLLTSAIALLNKQITKSALEKASQSRQLADTAGGEMQRYADDIRTLGMTGNAFDQWHQKRAESLDDGMYSSDWGGLFTSLSKSVRMFLQSAILGLAAFLVLRGELSAGAMIAGSILMGRALAPIDQILGQWSLITETFRSWRNLQALLNEVPEECYRMPLPRPKALLTVEKIAVGPPGAGRPILKGLSFDLTAGSVVAVVGASGSGKSTLARAVTGLWDPAVGEIRLDGALLGQYDPDHLGKYIGYLPQAVKLFSGTVAENIARLEPQFDAERVVEVAKQAAVHDLILSLPNGYDTWINGATPSLSGGQVQRIALARALYYNPVLLILDEPNSALDSKGSKALNGVIASLKMQGCAIMIMAHRPSVLEICDKILLLDDGMQVAFGPRLDVMKKYFSSMSASEKAAKQALVSAK